MNIAIIVAGGSGTRMGDCAVPKQFADVCGKPLIVRTLEKFDFHNEIDRIIIGCREDFTDTLRDITGKWNLKKIDEIVPGGETRQETVYKCLMKIGNAQNGDIILIHDAVRPLVTADIISRNIAGVKENGAVNTVIPSADTLTRSTTGLTIDEIPPRSEFFQVQTPQSFKYEIIMDAHKNAVKNGVKNATDDCRLVMENGCKVFLAAGDRVNFKVTTPEDLLLFRAYILAEQAE